jgi:chemosensory pili system protein ChpA (sensor histidine kinase/response regulator)
MDREQEIQFQFLDEAQDYIKTLEADLFGLINGIDTERINAALRAAHSIKGGAGMMGFPVLSDLAHCLEDALKVLKIQKLDISGDTELQNLLLAAVDQLRRMIEFDQRRQPIASDWVKAQVYPVFDQLHQRLGDPQEENAYSILSPEEGQDVLPLLFQTEVEESLSQLEIALHSPESNLAVHLETLSDELGGLGEMLELPAFVHLCQSVKQHLAVAPDQTMQIAQSALQAWRRSQALVLTANLSELPDALAVTGIQLLTAPEVADSEVGESTIETSDISAPEESQLNQSMGVTVNPVPPNPVPPIRADEAIVAEPETVSLQPFSQLSLEQAASDSLAEAKLNSGDASENTVRVPVRQLERLNDLFGELTIERNGLNLNLKRLRSLIKTLSQRIQILEHSNTELRDVYDQVSPPHPESARLETALDSRFDILELDRYDDVHLLSQEVMETIVQIQEVASDLELGLDEAEQTARQLNKTARHLQTRLTQVRMRPLSDIVDRFPRALRDLSLQYSKPVQLEVEGAATLIDRNILDALNEPLLHLIRNAFDHGIESAEVRQARGKPAQGKITICASHQNNRTLITVSDDGGGIPLEKIRARARQMGLDEMLLSAASDQELLSLIFEPGFSTTEQLTALSGRGVGMDVVRERIKQVQGEILVDTQAGVGTTFTLSVPFTLSVMRVLLAESNNLLMALPTSAIQEMIMLPPEQVLTTAGSQAFIWNDKMVQLICLKQWLQFNCPRPLESLEGRAVVGVPTVLLLPQADELVGLEVDRCWGEQEVAIRKIQGGPDLPPGFSHCTILGDGRVVPLVSIPDLLRWLATCQRQTHSSLLPPQPDLTRPDLTRMRQSSDQDAHSAPRSASLPAPQTVCRSILVVDDSVNVRRFLALTLEKAGYRVIQARDGQEALDRLATEMPVQAVVCDIEMPRLDGYGFLARLRSDPTYEQLPVAMLTTRSSDKHRQLALSLGATAYFSKPFNEQVLLRALEEMVRVL